MTAFELSPSAHIARVNLMPEYALRSQISRLIRRLRALTADTEHPISHSIARPVDSVNDSPETTTFRAMSTDRALWRARQRGVEIATVIDVGASNGMWSAVCEKHYPDANYLLVEAQDVHRPALELYCAQRQKTEFVLAAAGRTAGEIYFDDADPFGGVANETATPTGKTMLPQTAIDIEIAKRGLPGPYLLKLDTHGYEVPILDGAIKTMQSMNLGVIETYNFRLSDQALLMHEMIAHMRGLGFGVTDMSEPLWREYDRSFWQVDLFFQPLTHPEFRHNGYR